MMTLLDNRDLAGETWLDAGCGSGTLSCHLALRGCAVTGVDASSEMVRFAKELVSQEGTAFPFAPTFKVVQSIEKLSWPDSSLDGILCSSVLEYLDRPQHCLREFERVLKPGGLLLVSVPNRRSFYRRAEKFCFWTNGGAWPKYLGFSKNEYNCNEFYRLLESYGLDFIANSYYGARMPRWLGRSRFFGGLLLVLATKRGASLTPQLRGSP
ncbi:MAG: class I SAM-dependent methyltransferase [Candidatus Nealsonbacteria bacterium]|nr:class I SAM-dependent methyltransferase [Candidatus Nealsonbacteria bacterium]